MRISEFFKSNKGTWTLTAIFIVLLMAIIIYPEFWAGSDPAINAEVEKVNSDDAQLNDESTINNSNNEQTPTLAGDNQPDDGESRPSDPDTIVDPDATAANAAPPTWVEPLSARSDAPMVSAMTLPITITAFITALISWQSRGQQFMLQPAVL